MILNPPIVTILTPTYNRKEKLQQLYQSLVEQTSKNFIWLIVDDGSTDGTETVISGWETDSSFPVQYRKKENGGKHTALNFAYPLIETPLTFIVDSDDTLTENAISLIEEKYALYRDEPDLCGFSFMRGKSSGEGCLSCGTLPQNDWKESFVDCRINRNLAGDMAEVWFTHCLREYPFPEFPGEKFLGEDIVWISMANKYKLRFYNDIIYLSDYYDDGLTKSRRRLNIRSPKGCVARAEVFLRSDVSFKYKMKAVLQYIIYGKFAKYRHRNLFYRLDGKNRFLYLVLFCPAMILYRKWKKRYC